MNTKYNRITADPQISDRLSDAISKAVGLTIPEDIPHGDMPGDKIEIGESHISKARTIILELIQHLIKAAGSNPYGRATIAVCGGSGVGKSEIASVLSYMLTQSGIGSYIMSGDNYPHRIPSANDEERLHIFREGGVRAMAGAHKCTPEAIDALRKLQASDDDANESHKEEYDWFAGYFEGGKDALNNYLGTPAETDFDEVDSILSAFLDGADALMFRRMGRDESSLWYDEIDLTKVQVLILEWTHGNSDYMMNVDIPILLNSTPEETLEHRRSRNRDGKLDSPFTTLILNLEQDKLRSQAHKAKIIITKSGELINYETYEQMMK